MQKLCYEAPTEHAKPAPNVQKRACNVYVFQLQLSFLHATVGGWVVVVVVLFAILQFKQELETSPAASASSQVAAAAAAAAAMSSYY